MAVVQAGPVTEDFLETQVAPMIEGSWSVRPAAALAALATLALALPAPLGGAQDQTSLPDIEDEDVPDLRGDAYLATEAPQAIQEREFIRERIAEGMTKEQIKDALVAEFGPEVLAVPEAEGFDLVAWLVPGAVIAVAGGAIFIGPRRAAARRARWRSASRCPSPGWTRRSRSAWTRTWRAAVTHGASRGRPAASSASAWRHG